MSNTVRNFSEFTLQPAAPRLIALDRKRSKNEGLLSVVDLERELPFVAKRTFWVYGIDKAAERGKHANRHTEEVIFCLSGQIRVRLVDVHGRESHFELNELNVGLYIPSLTWIELSLSPNSVMLAFASREFRYEDYLFDYEAFRRLDRNEEGPSTALVPATPKPQMRVVTEAELRAAADVGVRATITMAMRAIGLAMLRAIVGVVWRWGEEIRRSWIGWWPRDRAKRKALLIDSALFLAVAALGIYLRRLGGYAAGDVADVSQFHSMGKILYEGHSPYTDFKSNYLPGLFPIFYVCAWLEQLGSLEFWMGMRRFTLFADMLALAALYRLVRKNAGPRTAYWSAIVYLLNPIIILIVGCHGQVDTFAFFFSLVAVQMASAQASPWLLGFMVAQSMCCKPQGTILVPLLALSPELSLWYRARTLLAVGLTIAYTLIPYAMRDGFASMHNIVTYRGNADVGLGGLLRGTWLVLANNWYLPGEFADEICGATRWMTLSCLSFVAFATRRLPLAERVGAVVLVFLVCHAGISAQYLCWPVLWLLASRAPRSWTAFYGVAAGIGAAGFYLAYFPAIVGGFLSPATHPEKVYFYSQYLAYFGIVATAIAYLRLILPRDFMKGSFMKLHLAICLVATIPFVTRMQWLLHEIYAILRMKYFHG